MGSRKGYAKCHDLLFDLKNDHAESIILLFDPKNDHAKLIIPLFESRKGHAKWQERILEKCFGDVFEVLISRDIFLCYKTKALRICGKIRSAKRKKSI